jgi:cytochrome c553
MNKNIARVFLLLLAVSVSSGLLAARPDGRTIALHGSANGALSCIACHGQQGEGNAEAGYPYLAGLPADYIENQLTAFSNGNRMSAIMKPVASNLTQQDIVAVAEYYAGLQNSKLTGSVRTTAPENYSTGAALALNGKWAAGVPACFKCHGAGGQGVAPHFPPIVGQPEVYLRNQLIAWQTGARRNDPLGLMQSVVKSLNQDEINAVARYLAAPTGH